MSSFLLATITINALFTLFPKQFSKLREETDKCKRDFTAIFGSIADILSSSCENKCELSRDSAEECKNRECSDVCENCCCKKSNLKALHFVKLRFIPRDSFMRTLPQLVGFFGYIFSFISWLASVLEKISALWCCSALCAACCLLIENKRDKDLNYWYLLLISPVFIYALLLVMQFVSILLYEILGGTICSISYCHKAYIEARKQSKQILTSEIVEDVLSSELEEK